MKVTIGVPCYNQASYMREAIDSALNQTYKNIEIIIVNDGATDDTRLILEEYKYKRKYDNRIEIVHQVNKGLASARNTAIMHMTGDYFLPLDADDILLPDCVKKIVQVAIETNADVIAPSIHCFGLAEQDVIMIPDPKLEDFKVGNRLAYCSAIKKEALLECGGYSPRMDKGWEDLHLWYDLLTRGKKIVTIPEVLVNYRTKKESMWTKARDNHGEELWEQIIKDFPQVASHKK